MTQRLVPDNKLINQTQVLINNYTNMYLWSRLAPSTNNPLKNLQSYLFRLSK